MEDMVMEAMDMAEVTMARGRLKLSQDILEDMVVMVMDVDMEVMDGRGYYGKREADAEPGYLRGYGGYGRGYGYG